MASRPIQNQKDKPILVFIAFPAPGHCNSCIQIAEHLSKRGFEIYFIGGTKFGPAIKHAGAKFIENTWDFKHDEVEERKGLEGPDLLIFDFIEVFLKSIPQAYGLLKQTLELACEEHPGREVVIVQESSSMGLLPLLFGAPLPKGYSKFPKILNFHASFNLMESKDVFPIGPGLPPPTTNEGWAQVAAMNDGVRVIFQPARDRASSILKSVGATREFGDVLHTLMTAGDVTTLQYSPSLDYPRSDLHHQIRFVGLMPLKTLSPDFKPPTWLDELSINAALPRDSPESKKIIFVSQGTVATEIESLLLPTLEAFADRPDVCIIATLGIHGRKIPDALKPFTNAIITDFIPYDAVLPLTDVFVSNGGFGAFAHGVMNGVPMVLCGVTQDKPEVCARAEMAGIAVNLRVPSPTAENVVEAVEKVLNDPGYKQRVLEVKKENEEMDSLGTVEKIVLNLAGQD